MAHFQKDSRESIQRGGPWAFIFCHIRIEAEKRSNRHSTLVVRLLLQISIVETEGHAGAKGLSEEYSV